MYDNLEVVFINKTKKEDLFFCKVCNFPLSSYEDFRAKNNYSCCFDCFTKFAESRKNEWKKGWRPTKDMISKHIKSKKQLNSSIVTIKEK